MSAITPANLYLDSIPSASLTVGTGTAAGSAQPLEVTNNASGGCGIAITTGATGAATAVECYVTHFIPADNGIQYKAGSIAAQWANKAASTGLGYASWNVHSSYFTGAGVQADDIWLCGWGNHGAAFFPSGTTTASAPGQGILKVNGQVHATGASALDGVVTVGSYVQFTTSTSRVVPGATSFSIRNSGNTADNLLIPDSTAVVALNGFLLPNNVKYQVKNSSGTATDALTINASNQLELNANSQLVRWTNVLTATTVGGAGGASALPATPLGYKRESIAGVGTVKFPYYPDV